MTYTYKGYPSGCPPDDCDDCKGTYYRLCTNDDVSDPKHYKSYFQLGKRRDSDDCEARALSLRCTKEQAISLIDMMGDGIGRYILVLELNGGHGDMRLSRSSSGHCNWWVPDTVQAMSYVHHVEGPY